MRKRGNKLEIDELIEPLDELIDDDPVPHRALEALGILFMLVAVALCFALGSYDPADSTGDRNLVGQFGRRFADELLGAIGVVGYLGALFSVGAAGAALFGKLRLPSVSSMACSILIVVSVAISAHLLGGTILGKPAGGMLGLYLGEYLVSAVGPVGSWLTTVGALLIGLLGIADASLVRLLRTIGVNLGQILRILFERYSDHQAAKRAARRRTLEIREAARQTEEDTHRREERRRAMVMRAEAEAEARALQKIALERQQLDGEAPWPSAVQSSEVRQQSEVSQPEVVAVQAGARSTSIQRVSALVPIVPQASTRVESNRASGFDRRELTQEPAFGDWPILKAPNADSGDELVGSDVQLADPAAIIEQIDAEYVRPSEAVSDTFAPPEDPMILEQLSLPEKLHSNVVEMDNAESAPFIHERKIEAVRFDDDTSENRAVKGVEKRVYRLPPLNLLDHEGESPELVDQAILRRRATRLEEKLETYGVSGKVTAIRPGPVVTTYEYEPAPGVKVSKIANLQDDIAMSMEALRVRIVAPIPGRGVVGIELPNEQRENVYMKEIAAHDRFKKSKSLLTLALGKDAEGNPQVRDLQKMPHLLVAGTTGSGKSVSINTMILSMLYKATPEQVKFIMVDPKMLELSLYNDIPHLLLPVVTDPQKASLALQWTVDEMERRYRLLSDFKVRDLETFNKKLERLRVQRWTEETTAEEPPPNKFFDPWAGKDVPDALPYIVVLIDEFADLMTVASRDVEISVQRLAQKARAAGIHVLLATQRPSTDVITGVIKNNFPCRLAFRVASRHDSSTIINMPGAEALLGRGDSLMMDTSSPNPSRIHGSFVSEEEVERVVEFWKEQGRPVYDETILQPRESEEEGRAEPEDVDEHYDLAVKIITDTRKASISGLQRRLRVGYNRAARMIEMMEAQGIIGPAIGAKGEREVLLGKTPSERM